MLVMLVIGLFTYRIILRALGVTDYGVYSAVAGVLTMFLLVMNTVTAAISRFITVSLGKDDPERLRSVFSTSLLVMAGFSLLLILLTETAGLWYLHQKMVIPDGRMGAADIVLQTAMLLVVVNLLSVPYTAAITAHEHMQAYARISIIEAVLKLGVAFGVLYSPADRLATYAVLLLAVGIVTRLCYGLYAWRRFPESRTGLGRADRALVGEMAAFAGWNFLGSGTYMLNTQGINQLMNHFFGVGMNAARGIADKVEQVVRQFATNIALALNPQLTKSYVSGNREYAFELVCKGSKYYFWVLWALSIPFLYDAGNILSLWLGEIPPEAARFTRLTLLCFLVDFTPNTLITLEQAHGKIRRFYLLSSAVAVLAFPVTWIAYRFGAPAWTGYAVFIGFYLLKAAVMLGVVHRDTGLPVGEYLRKAIVPSVWPGFLSLAIAGFTWRLLPDTPWRFLVVAAAGVVSLGIACWNYGLTPGEKNYVFHFLKKK